MFGKLLGLGQTFGPNTSNFGMDPAGTYGQEAPSKFGPMPQGMAQALMQHGMSASQPGAQQGGNPLAGMMEGLLQQQAANRTATGQVAQDPRAYIQGMLTGVTGQQMAPNGQPMAAGPMDYLQNDANQAASDGARDYILRLIMSGQGRN